MPLQTDRVQFAGTGGTQLAGRIDLPDGPPRAFALFAHCFSCSKDILAARQIAQTLTAHGFGVMRFDFTGLGGSGGDFGAAGFSANLADLAAAAEELARRYMPPALLIGHSLGGAAVLASADQISSVRAVVTIGAPAEVSHVLSHFGDAAEMARRQGTATVKLGTQSFTVSRDFVEDFKGHDVLARVARMHRPLLILHAPLDQTVGIDNAGAIFTAARHPKSFVSLDNADHLLTRKEDAAYAAEVIAAWADRYLPAPPPAQATAPAHTMASPAPHGAVVVTETGVSTYQNIIEMGAHRMLADEPKHVGGQDTGPSPFDLLSAALGACTSMTLRMYAARKDLPLERIRTEVHHRKADPVEPGGPTDLFDRRVRLDGPLTPEQRTRLLEIAGKCPVHRTLEAGARITVVEDKE